MHCIIKKWYDKLGFAEEYGDLISYLLMSADEYSLADVTYEKMREIKNPHLNLAYFLLQCEDTEKKYIENNIPLDIMYNTLSDLKLWADRYRDYSGEKIGFEETGWLNRHTDFQLFKLGRLQFAFGKAECTDEEYGIEKGENIIEVHIPSGGKLDEISCEKSFAEAGEFFKKYFPEYNYRFYTCHSWLLDDNLRQVADENSNILKFRELFSVINIHDSNAAIKYIYRWNIKEEEIKTFECKNSFQENMKKYLNSGGKLCEAYGIIKI